MRLRPCRVRGCPWRGADPADCPLHEAESAWERQGQLLPDNRIAHKARGLSSRTR